MSTILGDKIKVTTYMYIIKLGECGAFLVSGGTLHSHVNGLIFLHVDVHEKHYKKMHLMTRLEKVTHGHD